MKRRHILLLAPVLVAAAACSAHSRPVAPSPRGLAVSLVSGDRQSAPLHTPLPHPVVFRVTDAWGRPWGGAEILLAWPFRGQGDQIARSDSLGIVSFSVEPLALGAWELSASVFGSVSNVVTCTVTGL